MALNLLLKSFDGPYCKTITEEAFRGRRLGTVLSIMNHTREMPALDAERHEWMPAAPFREGNYDNVDWNSFAPLDEELVEAMRHCEAVFLTMIERYATKADIPYHERRRQYLDHLRFWNHTLDTEAINLFVINHAPHQCYDYVIYCLCKYKKIPTYQLERCYIVDGVFFIEDFEESTVVLRDAMKRLRLEYADPHKEIPLSPLYEEYMQTQTSKDEYPWYTGARDAHLAERNFIRKWMGKGLQMLYRKPKKFLASICSSDFWKRKIGQHRTVRLYDRLAMEPDCSVPYVYVPLHMQPEETTCPRAGVYVYQECMIQLLAAYLPSNVRIYVKEHPNQGEQCRSESFYQALADIPSVTLVPRETNTFTLTHNAAAIATATGTAGFEALFRGKPVFMFGFRFYQYAPGVHHIRTKEDCERAVQCIFKEGDRPTLREMRLFLKAIDDCSVPYEGGLPDPDTEEIRRRDKRAYAMGTMMRETLAPFFS